MNNNLACKEAANGLYEMFGSLPNPKLKRNDLCLCGSDKKYKNCCINKNKYSNGKVRLESCQIKFDALTQEESQIKYAPPEPEDEETLGRLHSQLSNHPETVTTKDSDYFKQLNSLRIKYPENPLILNYIAKGYELLGLNDHVIELTRLMAEKFPDYLFALTAQANLYLNDGLTEKAFELLKKSCSLRQLYPHRTVFHVSEVRVFESTMVSYYCAVEDLDQAEFHLDLLKRVVGENDSMYLFSFSSYKKLKMISRLRTGISRLQNSFTG